MRYAAARYVQQCRDERLAEYITESLRCMGENVARVSGGNYIQERWADVVNPPARDARTGEEIAADVIRKAGLKVVNSVEFI